jgi:hypothetical protein
MRKRLNPTAAAAVLLGVLVESCGGDADNGAPGVAALTSAMVLQPGPALVNSLPSAPTPKASWREAPTRSVLGSPACRWVV